MVFLSLPQRKLKIEESTALIEGVVKDMRLLKFPCGFKQTFNPSWIFYNDELIMAVRAGNFWESPFSSYIGICPLDPLSYEPLQAPIWLDIPLSHPEDPRLIVVQGKLWMLIHARGTQASFKVFACPLERVSGRWQLSSPPLELIYPDAPAGRIEKNWMPLIYQDELYLIYAMSPYTLIKPDLSTGLCTKVDVPPTIFPWAFGRAHGSAQVVPEKEGYIGIFHSAMRTEKRPFRPRTKYYYFLGAFTLTQDLHLDKVSSGPFAIPGFYNQGGDGTVVFPCGLLNQKEELILSAGKNDRSTLIITLNKARIAETLYRPDTDPKTS